MCVRLNRHIQVDFLYRYLPHRAGARARDRHRPRSASPSSPMRPSSSGSSWAIIEGEEMTTIRLPKNLIYGCVFIGFV